MLRVDNITRRRLSLPYGVVTAQLPTDLRYMQISPHSAHMVNTKTRVYELIDNKHRISTNMDNTEHRNNGLYPRMKWSTHTKVGDKTYRTHCPLLEVP